MKSLVEASGQKLLIKAKVRGIYSTALTKLLLDNKFEIVQPSATTKQRFVLDENPAKPDLEVKDRWDLQGVCTVGTFDAVVHFQSILQSAFEDVLTRKWPVSVDGIYKGEVVGGGEDTIYINIGDGVLGELPRIENSDKDTKQLVVQVQKRRMGSKHPFLTTKLKVIGQEAILVQDSTCGVSLRIRDLSRREELYALGKELAPIGWGIIWREGSANLPNEALKEEITALARKVKTINERSFSVEVPTLIIEGSYFMDVELPSISKKRLDILRGHVAQTLPSHHFYKSCGDKVSVALEMAENLLENGEIKDKVEEMFKKQTMSDFPEAGSSVEVQHVKPSGFVLSLGRATIENISSDEIKYSRTMRSDGFYNGLDIRKKAGDRAVSETKPGQWSITTRYFSEGGEWKGTYINLSMPVEVYPDTIRCIDLEVDVCIKPNNTVDVLDLEKLEIALEKGLISKRLLDTIREKVREIEEAKSKWFDA